MKALYRLLYYLSILLTSILAGFTLAGAFAGDASPEGFKLMPFIGLVLPILLLANGRLCHLLDGSLAMLGFHSFNRHTGKLGVSDPCPPVPAF